VNLASTVVRGQGGLTVKATPAGGDVTVVAAADLDGLSVQKTSAGTTTLNKPAGLPLRLDVDVKKTATAATINAVKVVIGKSSLAGRGTVSDLGKKGERLALDFGTVDVAFNDLRQALPGASKLPAGGRLKSALSLRGGLSAQALGIDAKNLDISFGSTRIAGSVGVDNLEAPRLDVNLPTLAVAFDDVRPLLESPGDLPAGGRFSGSLVARGDTAKPATMSVDVKIDALSMAKSDLKGTVKLTNLDQPRFTIATQSEMLDVDALKAAFGGGSSSSSSSSSTADENPHGLSKSARALLAGVSGKATLTAKRARVKDMAMSNFNGVLVVTRGVARFDTLTFGFYGGTVTASGTTLNLPAERTGYDLAFKAKDVDFGAFLADQSGVGRVFTGKVSPNLALKGRGIAAGDFASNAEGPAELAFSSLNIASLNLLEPLGGAVKKSGKGGAFNANAASTEGKQGLKLSGFTALTRLVGGKMRLEKPIETDTPLGRIKIEGGTSLANTLDFKTTLQLTPAMIGKLTGGKVKPKEAIPVPMKIGGSWDKPQVTGVDVDKLLLALVGDVAKDILDKGKQAVGGKVKDAVGDALGGLLGGNDKGKKKKRK
jgi:hypothetical protein